MARPIPQALGTPVSGVGAITVAWPAHQANDVGLLVVETANQAVTLGTNAANWTVVPPSPQGTGTAGGTAATRLSVWWSRATSGAMGNVGINDSGDHQLAQIVTIRNCATTGDPYHITAGSTAAAPTTAVSIPGGETFVDDCLIVLLVSNATDTTTPQVSGGTNPDLTLLAERADTNVADGNGGGFAIATGLCGNAGVFGPTTSTLATASVQARMMIAFMPASPAGSLEFLEPGTYGPGTITLQPRVIPGTLSFIGMRYDTTHHTDPAVVVSAVLEMSMDGGLTWERVGAFQREGGPGVERDGVTPKFTAAAAFPLPPGTGRRIRGSAGIAGGSLETSASLEWL